MCEMETVAMRQAAVLRETAVFGGSANPPKNIFVGMVVSARKCRVVTQGTQFQNSPRKVAYAIERINKT